MPMLQKIIERTILASRYILVVYYIGLAASLILYAGQFLYKLSGIALQFPSEDDNARPNPVGSTSANSGM